jgi:hypothetical protein
LEPRIVHHTDGTTSEEELWEGKGVHSSYENDMLDRHSDDLVIAVTKDLAKIGNAAPTVKTGQEAALLILQLMSRAQQRIPPDVLVEFFVDAGGKKTVAMADALWDEFGGATAELMAHGAHTLAAIWESAWEVGRGRNIAEAKLKIIPESTLSKLYLQKGFVRSLDLDGIKGVLK